MIDNVHGRTTGTASRNFRQNRDRFIEGKHFFNIDQSLNDEFRRLEIPNRGLTLITEFGYLLLAKSLTDDRAWDVQEKSLIRIGSDHDPISPPQWDAPRAISVQC